jgi:hypothetical protein
VDIMKLSYRLFLCTIFCAFMFEVGGLDSDPIAQLGNRYLAPMSSWTGIHIILNVFEVCLMVTALAWLVTRKRVRGAHIERTLTIPIIAFGALLAFGVVNGLTQAGGDLTFALWEVRAFAVLIAVYLLSCVFISSEDRVNDLIWSVLIASTVLAVDNTLRWLLILRSVSSDDLAYDHVDSVVLVFATLLCLCLLAFGGTRAQRRYALVTLPLFLFAMEAMKRRAAFVILAVGVLILCVFLLRLRPRIFWRIVPPVALACVLYLAVFWNQNGTLAQPARAISSQFSPDPRDAASNDYRVVERYDIISNIERAPLTGLGFGQQYVMYIPLPNLGTVWPFWHYMTHNAILWVWMKDGALGFAAFWWLLGRGVYDGSRAVATQREEWSLAEELHRLLSRQPGNTRAIARAMQALKRNQYEPLRPVGHAKRSGGSGRRKAGELALGLNVPTWERSDERSSRTARNSGALAFLVAAISMIPVQTVFSYVDLGLTNERNMAVLGVALAVISQASLVLGIQWIPRKRRRGQPHEDEAALMDTQDRIRALVSARSVAAAPLQVVPSTMTAAKHMPTSRHAVSRVGQRGTETATTTRDMPTLVREETPLPWERT